MTQKTFRDELAMLVWPGITTEVATPLEAATLAYEYADAMLAARKQAPVIAPHDESGEVSIIGGDHE